MSGRRQVPAGLAAQVAAVLLAHPGGAGAPWPALTPRDVEELSRFCEELARANAAINLTGLTTPQDMAVRHVLDALTALPLLDGTGPLLDLGSGGGVPGLPLALMAPGRPVVLVESRKRKAAALAALVQRLGLSPRVTVVAARAEAWLAGNAADEIVARAVGGLSELLALLAPVAGSFRRLVAMKGPAVDHELAAARPRLARWGFAEPARRDVELPAGAGRRTLLVFEGGRSE